MRDLLQRAEAEIENRQLLSRGQKFLVAVSGGADSMVLLHTLNSLAAKKRWKISVAHFNHRLRGRASDADEKLVRKTAKKLRLKFFGDAADVKRFAAQSKLSIEMAARKLRHEFLARVARENKISTIALAHHADDQVELFFLRLLRGAGGEGLAGMKWKSLSPADKTIALVRPLLGFSKNEILSFAREQNIPFREDASNLSEDFLRNRIRNELLPLLRKKYQPGLNRAVLRTMEIVGAEAEFVGKSELSNSKFENLHVAIQRRRLQRRLESVGVAGDFDLIEQLRKCAGTLVSAGAGVSVKRNERGEIELRREAEPVFDDAELDCELGGKSGDKIFGGKQFGWKISPQKFFSVPKPKPGIEVFDADKVGREIVLRHWRAGDRFQPIGMKSALKLQDFFVNAKIPAAQRRQLVLATTAGGDIFWVEGLRIGERFKLTVETRRILRWSWRSP